MNQRLFSGGAAALSALLLCLALVLPRALAAPPRVTQVTGEVLRIDAGETQGVRAGTQGKVYRHRRVGGQEQRLDVARVQVERVLASSSFLRVLETGSNLGVEAGDLVDLPGLGHGAAAVGGTVSDLLERATLQIMEDKLTSPAGDNAFETLSAVLAREPGNAHAQSLLGDIADQYLSWGEMAVARGELERGRSHVAKALRVQPGHAGALALRGRVEALEAEEFRAAEKARRAQLVADALTRANIALEGGDANAARDAIAAARALDPNAPEIAGAQEGLRRLERDGVVTSIGVRLKRISAGSFQMGSPSSEHKRDDDERQHRVTIANDFLLGATEITQAQWRSVMGSNPSSFKGDELPVERVSWLDAVEFCNRLSEREGLRPAYRISGDDVNWIETSNGYRLPTEAEWEYACRAGTTTPFSFGNNITPDQVNYHGDRPYRGGRKGRYRERTVDAGSLPANPWGLHEMHGSVWEWCWDWYGSYPSGSVTDPTGPLSGSYRVLRGGGWLSYARSCRSADRYRSSPDFRIIYLGFRLARSAP